MLVVPHSVCLYLKGIFLKGTMVLLLGGVLACEGQAQNSNNNTNTLNAAKRWIFMPFLVFDRERLLSQSKTAQKIETVRAQELKELGEENKAIDKALAYEEKELTHLRSSLSLEEFQKLANEFDSKVTALRAAQTEKTIEINKRAEAARRGLFDKILPILEDLARENGALAIIDIKNLILSANAIDITDIAIERIDALFAKEM